MDYCASTTNLEEIWNKPNFKFVRGDILSADLLRHVLEVEQIDTVMHFAAQVSNWERAGRVKGHPQPPPGVPRLPPPLAGARSALVPLKPAINDPFGLIFVVS